MRKFVVIIAALPLLVLTLFVPASAAQEKSETKTGSIKGNISVRGVRNPENVLVYIEKAPGEYPAPKEPAKVDQKKLEFTPHVLPIVKGTTVRFLNSDPILHNVFWPKSKDGSYKGRNLGTWGKGGVRKYTFKTEGSVVLLHSEFSPGEIVLSVRDC